MHEQEIIKRLDHLHQMLHHAHEMLHALTLAVADIARQIGQPGMTPAETKAIVDRLLAHAAKLEGIAVPKP